MNPEETQKFLRHWLLLLGAACVWFLWESRYVRNIWFMAMAGMALVLLALGYLIGYAFPDMEAQAWFRGQNSNIGKQKNHLECLFDHSTGADSTFLYYQVTPFQLRQRQICLRGGVFGCLCFSLLAEN